MENTKIIEDTIEKKFNELLAKLPEIKSNVIKSEDNYFNFSIIELYQNTIQTIIDIIKDLINIFDTTYIYNNSFYKRLFFIFFNEKRLFYIGIILILLSFIIYFIDGATI